MNKKYKTILLRLALIPFLFFSIFPLYWLIKVSLTPKGLLYSEGVRLWPSKTTWDNYYYVLTNSDFPLFFQNSLIVALSTSLVVSVLAALSGYALSRFQFKGKMLVYGLLLLTQMFPIVMLVAPLFKMMSTIGLTNSLFGLILVYSAFNLPFAIFLMQSFFDGVPKDLEEASMIDGSSRFYAFRHVLLPVTLPGIAATLGFVFTAAWSELLLALMMTSQKEVSTFPVGLLGFVSKFSVDFGQMMAASVLALIPAGIFFFAIQKFLVQGLTAGAVKG